MNKASLEMETCHPYPATLDGVDHSSSRWQQVKTHSGALLHSSLSGRLEPPRDRSLGIIQEFYESQTMKPGALQAEMALEII